MYVDDPYFGAELSLATDQHLQRPLQSNAFRRFGTEENMENYFVDQKGRAWDREQRVRADYARGMQASVQHTIDFYPEIQRQGDDEDEK